MPLQGKASALASHVVCDGHFYRWAPEVVSCSTAAEVVPREVAERLARAVSASLTHGEESPLKDALQEYLNAYPWSDL